MLLPDPSLEAMRAVGLRHHLPTSDLEAPSIWNWITCW